MWGNRLRAAAGVGYRQVRAVTDENGSANDQVSKNSPPSASLPQAVQLSYRSGWVEHTRLPPHDGDRFTSATKPFAFGISFTGHTGAVVEHERNDLQRRSFRPGTIGLNGPGELHWLHLGEMSEGLEIHPSRALLEAVAAGTRCRWDVLEGYRQTPVDDVVWGAAVAFRAAVLGRRVVSNAMANALITNVTTHVAVHHFGGTAPGSFGGRLPQRALREVGSHLRRHSDRVVPLAEMAAIASMSPFHFHRMFGRTVGITPAAFAMSIRIERAHRMITAGHSVSSAAAAIGMPDLSYFRRSCRRFLAYPIGA